MTIHKGDHRFYIENEQGDVVAFIEYSFEDEHTLIANSTFVDPSLRGKGVARELLERLVSFARENGYKIRPLCSYVVKAFNETDAYDDVKIR